MTMPNDEQPDRQVPNDQHAGHQQPGYQQPGHQQPGHQLPNDQQPGHQQPDAGAGVPAWQPAPSQKKGGNTALRILIPVVAVIAAVGASLGVRAFFNATSEPTPAALATEAAKQVNENYTFPIDVDQVTKWEGVEANGAELDYAYTIDASVDPSAVTKDDIRSSVVSNVCQKKESRDLLSKAVVMKYSYTFAAATDRTIDFAVTTADC